MFLNCFYAHLCVCVRVCVHCCAYIDVGEMHVSMISLSKNKQNVAVPILQVLVPEQPGKQD